MEIDLEPAVQRKEVEQADRTDVLLPLVGDQPGALPIASEATVYSSFLTAGKQLTHHIAVGHGAYLYVLEGGPLRLNGERMPALSAAKIHRRRHRGGYHGGERCGTAARGRPAGGQQPPAHDSLGAVINQPLGGGFDLIRRGRGAGGDGDALHACEPFLP